LLLSAAASTAVADGPGGGSNKVNADVDTEVSTPGASWAKKFRSSVFFFDQSITPETLDAGAQLSSIPSYQWWLSLRPRFYIKPKLSIRLREDLTVEWLNAADTTRLRDAQWGDLWTDLIYDLPSFWGITTSAGLRAIWGVSLESRGTTSVVRLGPTVTMDRAFPTRIGEFGLTLGMYGTYNFVRNTSAQSDSSYGCVSTDFTPTVCSQNGGAMNTQGSLVTALSGRYNPIPKLTIGVSYILIDSWVYQTPEATIGNQSGVATAVDTSPNAQRFKQASWFLASVDYDLNTWFTMSVGYYCYRSILNPDGTYGDPLYAPGGASRIFLTGTFALDKLYMAAAARVKRQPRAASVGVPTLTNAGPAVTF
jgi:hypothetical protein